MSFAKEFREFAIKGNVTDMAVGIVIGAAFGKIVTSLVSDVITPPLGYFIGGVDFTGLTFSLPEIAGRAAVTVRYGAFLQTTFDFLIVALAIFLAVKAINRIRRTQEQAPAVPAPLTKDQALLQEIRDLLKQNAGR